MLKKEQASQQTRKIYILVTRMFGNRSKAISFFTNSYYTHSSIGLEEDLNTFYTFTIKGFFIEKVTKYVKPDKSSFPCQLYEISVSQEKYDEIKNSLQQFTVKKEEYFYARLGVILCFFRIPCKFKGHYFCSQFIAEVLENCQIAKFRKPASLCTPKDFTKMEIAHPIYRGTLRGYLKHFKICAT